MVKETYWQKLRVMQKMTLLEVLEIIDHNALRAIEDELNEGPIYTQTQDDAIIDPVDLPKTEAEVQVYQYVFGHPFLEEMTVRKDLKNDEFCYVELDKLG